MHPFCLFKLLQECLFSSSGLVHSAKEERRVDARDAPFVRRNSLNGGLGEVSNSAGLVSAGTLGPAVLGGYSESAIVNDEQSGFTEKTRRDLQEGLMTFFEQEDPSRRGVIEYSKVIASLNSLCFRLTFVFFQYRTLVVDHLDKSGLGVNEQLKLLLLSVVAEMDTNDGVIYYDAVGDAGFLPVVFL